MYAVVKYKSVLSISLIFNGSGFSRVSWYMNWKMNFNSNTKQRTNKNSFISLIMFFNFV